MKAKESTIKLLQTELSEKSKTMTQLERDSDGLFARHLKGSEEMAKLNIEVEDYKRNPPSSYVDQLKEYIKILELQISVNNGQNEILTYAGQQKDTRLVQLRNQIRDMGTRLGKVVEEAAQLPDTIVPHVSNKPVASSNVTFMMGKEHSAVPQSHPIRPHQPAPQQQSGTNSSHLLNMSQVAQHQTIRANSVQSSVYNPFNITPSSSVESSQREDVMVFEGSLYQRLGPLQQG